MDRNRPIPRAAIAPAALFFLLLSTGGVEGGPATPDASAGPAVPPPDTVDLVETTAVTPATDGVEVAEGSALPDTALATFAGGCFWCMEEPFDVLPGVHSTIVGYTGGRVADPTYEEVSAGGTGHREAVRVAYDPSVVSYTKLLTVFWHNIDPADGGGQFCDRGGQYTTAVFVHNGEQERLARSSRQRLDGSGILDVPVATPVVPADTFYRAEDYHQDYYDENPARYEFYRWRCGRDDRLEEIWGDAAGH